MKKCSNGRGIIYRIIRANATFAKKWNEQQGHSFAGFCCYFTIHDDTFEETAIPRAVYFRAIGTSTYEYKYVAYS